MICSKLGKVWIGLTSPLLLTWGLAGATALAQTSEQDSQNMQAIEGRWIRTDAPYVIELSPDESDSLQASYFNPKQIHVERTEFGVREGVLHVLIELQDVNYPGSTYFLAFVRDQDILHGIYYLPQNGQQFEVAFTRAADSPQPEESVPD